MACVGAVNAPGSVASPLLCGVVRGSTLRAPRRELDAVPRSSGRLAASGALRRFLRLLAWPLAFFAARFGLGFASLCLASSFASPSFVSPCFVSISFFSSSCFAGLRSSAWFGASLRSGLCPSVRAPSLRGVLFGSALACARPVLRVVAFASSVRLGSLASARSVVPAPLARGSGTTLFWWRTRPLVVGRRLRPGLASRVWRRRRGAFDVRVFTRGGRDVSSRA